MHILQHMEINETSTRWDLGQMVWLKVQPEMKGMITGIVVRSGPSILYFITWNDGEESMHYEMEVTEEKPTDFEE